MQKVNAVRHGGEADRALGTFLCASIIEAAAARANHRSLLKVPGRTMEFVAVGLIATSLAAAWQMTEQALARPLALAASALGP